MMQNFGNKSSVQKCAQNAGSNVLNRNPHPKNPFSLIVTIVIILLFSPILAKMAVHILPVARAHVYLDVQVNIVKHVLTVSQDFFLFKTFVFLLYSV